MLGILLLLPLASTQLPGQPSVDVKEVVMNATLSTAASDTVVATESDLVDGDLVDELGGRVTGLYGGLAGNAVPLDKVMNVLSGLNGTVNPVGAAEGSASGTPKEILAELRKTKDQAVRSELYYMLVPDVVKCKFSRFIKSNDILEHS